MLFSSPLYGALESVFVLWRHRNYRYDYDAPGVVTLSPQAGGGVEEVRDSHTIVEVDLDREYRSVGREAKLHLQPEMWRLQRPQRLGELLLRSDSDRKLHPCLVLTTTVVYGPLTAAVFLVNVTFCCPSCLLALILADSEMPACSHPLRF